MSNVDDFYLRPGVMTDLGDQIDLLADLPRAIPALCQVVQGALIHVFWAKRYGRELSATESSALNVRGVAAKLALMRKVSALPLVQPRPLSARQVGNCRDFSVLLCALLRHQGVPARARCGFGRYFLPNHYEDHWICEYWHVREGRWVMVDAQLDGLQREALKITFDPCDVPADQFWTGGQGWLACRHGQADPDHFGIGQLRGMWFIRGDLLRDIAALNNMELLPWDGWGLADKDDAALTSDDMALLDRVAALTTGGDAAWAELSALYTADERLRVPRMIHSYGANGPTDVILY